MRVVIPWLMLLNACVPEVSATTAEPTSTMPAQTTSTVDDGTGIQTVTGHSTESPTSTSQPGTSSTGEVTSSGATTTIPTTSEPIGECGNGVQEGVELCDDGNSDDYDRCTTLCRPPARGDGFLHEGEDCDDGNLDNTDECTEECLLPVCGDKWVQAGEECDDGNDSEEDACLSNCSAASCGDGNIWAGVEVCDDGFNDDTYNGCAPSCKGFGPRCGDGEVDKTNINQPKGFEYCDGVAPYAGVGCTSKCLYDFSQVSQMYCRSGCSWAGPSGCDQADADVFCRLKTGNPLSTADSFQLGIPTDQGGFPCANPDVAVELNGVDPRIALGPLPEYGINTNVYYQTNIIKTSHGGITTAAIVGAVCK